VEEENVIHRKTLIFAEVRNDSIFQIKSMPEGSRQIVKAL
jgi:hypothetical protein